MNKYLREVEVHVSRHFGVHEAIKFAIEHRSLFDHLYTILKTNVKCKFGKLVVVLHTKEWIEKSVKRGSPKYLDDDLNGVLMVEIPYDYKAHQSLPNLEDKKKVVRGILETEFKALPDSIGIDKKRAFEFLDLAVRKLE